MGPSGSLIKEEADGLFYSAVALAADGPDFPEHWIWPGISGAWRGAAREAAAA